MNFIDCRIVREADGLVAAAEGVRFPISNGKQDLVRNHVDREAVLGIRPEHIGLEPDVTGAESQAAFAAEVRVVESAGSEKIVHASCGRHAIVIRLDPHTRLKPGETARFAARMETAHVFDTDGQTLF
jgi:multiple sugar transport system ATP-binding protein